MKRKIRMKGDLTRPRPPYRLEINGKFLTDTETIIIGGSKYKIDLNNIPSIALAVKAANKYAANHIGQTIYVWDKQDWIVRQIYAVLEKT